MSEMLVLTLLLAAQSPEFAVSGFVTPAGLDNEGRAFQSLLVNELNRRGVFASATRSRAPCDNEGCAAAEAASARTPRVIIGSLQPFAEKILVTASVYEAGVGMLPGRYDLIIDTPADLDVAARRIAGAIADEGDTEENQALGAITELETEPDRRRQGDGGLSLSMGGLVPINDTYGAADAGLSVGLGYWYEGRNYALETAIGFRFSTDTSGERRFYEVPVDVGAYYILGLGDVAPFIGVGGGLRYLYQSRPGTIRVGSVISTVNEGDIKDDGFGFGGFARAGIMLLRTYDVRVAVSGRYTITFRGFDGDRFPQAGLFEVQVYF